MFLVLRLVERGESDYGLKINLATDGMAGMLPVFHKKEEALNAFPNAEILEICLEKGSDNESIG